MHNPLILLVPFILAATRSLAFAIRSPGKPGLCSTTPAEMEFQILLTVVFSLSGLLASLYLMIQFPELGSAIAELNQF
jgi:hypothetical protein